MSARPELADPLDSTQPPLPEAGMALLGEIREMLRDRVRLFSLEARRAGLALAQIVVMTILAAMLVMTAWLALVGGLAFALVTLGLHWALALLLTLALNLLAAWLLLLRIKSLAGYLGFPALTRQLGLHHPEP